MPRKLVKLGVSIISLPFVTAFGATYYYFPELRQNKKQLFKAFSRMCRVGYRGGQMALIYLLVIFILSQKNFSGKRINREETL